MTLPANRYFETQVLTAPPQRLRLMLIEAAIRSTQAALDAYQEARWGEGLEHNIKVRDLVAELLSGVDPTASPVARDVAGIYAFLFATLTDAQAQRDAAKLRDVLRVLEVERETWRQVCESIPSQSVADESPASRGVPAPFFAGTQSAGGFSVEA